jgi:serine protease Do
MSIKRTAVVGIASIALVAGGFAAGRVARVEGAPGKVAPTPAARAPTAGPPSFGDLAARVAPAVVHVNVVAVKKAAFPGFGAPDWFGDNAPWPGFRWQLPEPREREFRQHGTGSGVVIRTDGVVLTNNHVVDGARDITVTLADQREYPASVLGRDPKTDLAVLKIRAQDAVLPVATLGDSDALRVGDWVLAVGNPFGLSNTVTAGIVSAKGRAIGAGPYDDFIQTDAPINPGNSGGPLFNEHGEVVGINTAIFSQNGGSVGIGFAIPVNLVKELVPQLETTGSVTRGWIGVAIQDLTPALAESLGIENARGALVAEVAPDSPAATAGIQRGDVIIAYAEKPVSKLATLPAAVAATPIGKTVSVEVMRNGKKKTLEVTVARLAEETALAAAGASEKGAWGLAVRELDPQERARVGVDATAGVLVTGVRPDSPAAAAGVRPGDVILQANRLAVGSIPDLERAVSGVKAGSLLLLLHRTDGHDQFIVLAAK